MFVKRNEHLSFVDVVLS